MNVYINQKVTIFQAATGNRRHATLRETRPPINFSSKFPCRQTPLKVTSISLTGQAEI